MGECPGCSREATPRRGVGTAMPRVDGYHPVHQGRFLFGMRGVRPWMQGRRWAEVEVLLHGGSGFNPRHEPVHPRHERRSPTEVGPQVHGCTPLHPRHERRPSVHPRPWVRVGRPLPPWRRRRPSAHPRAHLHGGSRCLLCMKAVHPRCDDRGSVEADRYPRGMAAEPPTTHALASREVHRDPCAPGPVPPGRNGRRCPQAGAACLGLVLLVVRAGGVRCPPRTSISSPTATASTRGLAGALPAAAHPAVSNY
jgi:hypothetical protein